MHRKRAENRDLRCGIFMIHANRIILLQNCKPHLPLDVDEEFLPFCIGISRHAVAQCNLDGLIRAFALAVGLRMVRCGE